MNDALFYSFLSLIMGTNAIMLIIAFIFSDKKIPNKKGKGIENLDDIEEPKPKVSIPSDYKKYQISVIIGGNKGKIIRYGPDFITTNRALIAEYRSQGMEIETLTFKEVER